MKIRIGHLSTFYHTAILLMAGKDTESRLGAEIEWRLMGNGPSIMKAFYRDELDMAYIGLPPAIIGISQGIDVLCIAGGHMEGTVMTGKARWKGYQETGDVGSVLEQFRGRKIGVPGKGSIHDVILKDCLEQQGLEKDIEVVNYPWADMVTEAVVMDEVAAGVGTPALAVAVDRFAQGKILYPPSMLWPDNPSYGIVARKDFLEKEQERVRKFLELHEEATAFMRGEPRKASQAIAEFVNVVDEEFVLDTLRVSPKYCAQLTDKFIASTMRFVPVLKRLGYVREDVAEGRIFSRGIISRIHREKDHYGDGIADTTGMSRK